MRKIPQATVHPRRDRHPSNQFSSLPNKVVAMIDFESILSAFSSFGPFNNAIDTAPLTHIIVPTILAIVLILRIFTFSIPTKAAITNVTAGRRLEMALATEEEERYRPSKYKF